MQYQDSGKPLAYDAYQELAESYAAKVPTKPHNAYYERPAMVSLFPEVEGKTVLDAGCGTGIYTELLVQAGADVIGADSSQAMLQFARERVGGAATLLHLDLGQPLTLFSEEQFHFVNAALCLDYIRDWNAAFDEFYRILKPGGQVLFSVGHPSHDASYFETKNYFSVEEVKTVWTGFDKPVEVPSYRRSFEEVTMPVIKAGFSIDRFHEPLPSEDFLKDDPKRYNRLMHRPIFLCVRAKK